MAMNNNLKTALEADILIASSGLGGQDLVRFEADRDAALDALLKSDPANPTDFRKAVIDYQFFWQYLSSMQGIVRADPLHLQVDQFLDPNDPQNPFLKLHQLAAEQRVRFGLQKADQNVLIGILANNPDECRAYLAGRGELGLLKDAKGWQPNVMVPGPSGGQVPAVPPKNTSGNVLPDDAVTRIQVEASQFLLSDLIQKSSNKVALKQLLDATNQSELDAAMQALNFPQRALPPNAPVRITYPLATVPWLKDIATQHEKKAREIWAKTHFEDYVKGLDVPNLLAKKDGLEGSWGDYRESLAEPYKTDLSDEDLEELEGVLGAHYLQTVFSTSEEDLLSALNAGDDELEDEIDELLDEAENFDYTKRAVAANPALIRQGMLQGLIRNLDNNPANLKILSQINSAKNLGEFKAELGKLNITNVDWIEEDTWQDMQEWSHSKAIKMVQEQVLALPNNPANQDILKKINTAKTIEEFRDELKKTGIDPIDWITRADKDDIQKETRSHAFNMHLGSAKFGAAFRPQLLSAISQLPPKKQEALLQNPAQIHHLLNAKDAKAVQFYLGTDAPGVDAILKENARLAGFQKLHSVPIAKALANSNLGITLDDTQIAAINTIIKSDGGLHTDIVEYKRFVDKIKTACGISSAPNSEFYKVFDLNHDGSALLSAAKGDAILDQHRFNTDLYKFPTSPADTRNKELVGILLRIEKAAGLTDSNITTINNHFNNSKDLNEFLTAIGREPNAAINGLKTGIQNELPALLFNQLKIQSLAAPLRGTDMQGFNKARAQMNAQVDAMIETRKSFSDSFDKLKFLDDIDPVHLAAPQFIRECKDDPDGMRARFAAMAASCDITVDRLLRNQALLMAQLASLPKPISIPRGTDEDEFADRYNDVLDLREKLNEELAITNNNLKHFQKFQAKLSDPDPDIGILKAIDRAIDGKKNDYYSPANFTTTIIKAGNTITTAPSSVVTPPAAVRLGANSPSGTASAFLAKDRLAPGEKCEYSMKYDNNSGTNFSAKGKFTESHDKLASPAPTIMKGGKTIKQQECTFAVEEVPTQTIPPRPKNEEKLMAANVELYMSMAVAIISRFNASNPPSKTNPIRMNGNDEEAMRHLWTALVIVGEKNSKNMRFGMDAIQIESGPFNPSKERGLLGFKSDSFYSKYKQDHGHTIEAKVTHAKEMVGKQDAHSTAVKVAEKGMERYKKEVSGIRDTVTKAEKVREEEGVAPEKPVVGFKR